jgi:hypothetical protein
MLEWHMLGYKLLTRKGTTMLRVGLGQWEFLV